MTIKKIIDNSKFLPMLRYHGKNECEGDQYAN